jgi:hypothetical protein
MKTITVSRNTFGAIVNYTSDKLAYLETAKALIADAIKSNKLGAEFVEGNAKRGTSLNYDVYDVKGSTALIQRRDTSWDKYGAHPIKSYYLIRRVGRGVVVEIVENKATVNKAAKNSDTLGEAIAKAKVAKSVEAQIVEQFPALDVKKVSVCLSDAVGLKLCRSGIDEWRVQAGVSLKKECITLPEMLAAYNRAPKAEALSVIWFVVRRAAKN